MLAYFVEHHRYMNFFGLAILLVLAYVMSNNKKAVSLKTVIGGLLLQFALAVFILKTNIGHTIFATIGDGFARLYEFAGHGISFVFGNLANPAAGAWGMVFAIKVLPIIIFFGAFTSLLFYLGIIQKVVSGISFVVRPVLGTTGSETLCAIANSFLGQTEAPLVIRHYLPHVTRSEMMVVMTSGFATVSGSLLAVYAAIGVPSLHLLASSVMAIPASMVMAKILYPETEQESVKEPHEAEQASAGSANVLDAISSGTSDGLMLALNVGAMLISFLALIAMVNFLLGNLSDGINCLFAKMHIDSCVPDFSLNALFAYCFSPIAYLFGLTGKEALDAGMLLGTKVSINEFIALNQMVTLQLSERTVAILTYALCSFANFSCIGIQIGGIGALVPSKRVWLSQLGLRALLAATLANLSSACLVGLLI